MWVLFAVGVFVALLLFDRLRKFPIPAPVALLISIGIVVVPFILIPIIIIWLVVRWVSKRGSKQSPSNEKVAGSFCTRCGTDLQTEGTVCHSCGNALNVGG